MKRYEVIKKEFLPSINGIKVTATVANYGVMCEEDMFLTVRGYVATEQNGARTIYTRKNSKYCYEVNAL